MAFFYFLSDILETYRNDSIRIKHFIDKYYNRTYVGYAEQRSPEAYDAVWVMAYALNHTLEKLNNKSEGKLVCNCIFRTILR